MDKELIEKLKQELTIKYGQEFATLINHVVDDTFATAEQFRLSTYTGN